MPLRKSLHDYNMCNPAVAFLKSKGALPESFAAPLTNVGVGLRLTGTLNA
jgi:hypothetical protein